jgi:hypothetical protein
LRPCWLGISLAPGELSHRPPATRARSPRNDRLITSCPLAAAWPPAAPRSDLLAHRPTQDQIAIIFSLHSALSGIPASLLEGALVLLPRAAPFPRLERLRSPAWSALLPLSIIVGTFYLLVAPGLASAMVLAAALTTPLLAFIAVVAVVRARAAVLPLAAVAGALAIWATGMRGHVGTSIVTALACITVGAALQRLIPGRWLVLGVVAMSVVDIALLFSGPGYHQTALLAAAQNNFHGPRFTGARLGGTTIGYPDLFLAALLGSALAGRRAQLWAAALLTTIAVAYDSMLSPGRLLPATVPIALTLLAVAGAGYVRNRRTRPGPACAATPCDSHGLVVRPTRRTCPGCSSARRASLTPQPARTPAR